MPITKNGNGEIIETSPDDLDQFLRTGVMTKDEFAFADKFDRTKQVKFDPSAQAADTDVTLKSGAAAADITLTLPATTGTLAKTTDIAAFTTIQTPAGTSPVASGATDTLTLTSTGGTVIITGNSTTDTINLESAAAFTLGNVGSSPNAQAATLSAGVLNLEPASATQPGVMTTGAQTIAGAKTFSGGVTATVIGTATNVTGVVAEANGGTNQSTYAKGDTIYASASNTLSKLTVGASGQHIAVNSGIPAWEDFHNPTKYVTFYDDFLGGGTLGSPYFASIVNGTSALVGTTAAAGNGASVGRPGTVVFYAGSTSGSGYAQLYGDSRNAMLCVGGGTVTYETAVVLYALSNGTTRYRVDAGLIAEIAPSSSIANGIYFTYSDTINSGKWQFNCTASSSTTSVDTGITASTSWVKLGFVINAAGTSVQAYIDGSAVGSAITTNIPSAGLTFVWQVNKTVGTGVAQFTTDYVKFMSVLTSTR